MPKYKYKSITRLLGALDAWPPNTSVQKRKFRRLKRRINKRLKQLCFRKYECFDFHDALDGMAHRFAKFHRGDSSVAKHVVDEYLTVVLR